MRGSKLIAGAAFAALVSIEMAAAQQPAPPASVDAGDALRSEVRLADGRRLSFLHWPHPGKPRLLALHGKLGFASGFADLARRLGDRVDLYSIDMPGRGYSDWAPAGDYSVEATLADLAAAARMLNLGRFGIYGESYGAVVGLAYAAAHRDEVRFLILDDGGPTSLPGGVPAPLNPGQTAAAGAPAPAPQPLRFANWSEAEAWQRATCRSFCTSGQLESWLVRTPAGVVERSDVVGLSKSPRGAAFDDQWPAVRALRAPTLVIRAERGLLPAAIATAMRQANPRITVTSVPGATHTVHASRPAEAFTALEAFLARLPD